ncbi:MAG: type II toxin-antitoxin system VapC family toxin [Pseudomonadota bacterium]|nr:type II toxin-antitoxin system VapC family toxin [Pseudomonadota bacterium]
MMIYVDTSVLVGYYCPEALSSQAEELSREQIKPGLSSLTEVEFASAVAKKVRQRELSRIDGNRILAKFVSHVKAELFQMIPVEDHHWQLARGWIGLFATALRTLDALHLAIASDKELPLVTSDKTFFRPLKS